MTKYTLRATALCPIDGSRDHYDVEVDTDEVIEVGELRRFFDSFANTEILQEDLFDAVVERFGSVTVCITGHHPSPVKVEKFQVTGVA